MFNQLTIISFVGRLESGWMEDREMQMTFADRDRLLLDDITEMRSRTEERESKVAVITEKLDEELVLLTAFLENVAHRRPKGEHYYNSLLVIKTKPINGSSTFIRQNDGSQ